MPQALCGGVGGRGILNRNKSGFTFYVVTMIASCCVTQKIQTVIQNSASAPGRYKVKSRRW